MFIILSMHFEEIRQRAEKEKVSLNLVFKEYIQALILNFLFEEDMFKYIVLQGGTAIKFFYKGVRYSDDIDFVLRNKNTYAFNEINKKMKKISGFIERNIPIVKKSEFRIQKEDPLIIRYLLISDIEILKMKDRTRIEIGLVPSYSYQICFLKTEYLPFSAAVAVETSEEILSDKVVAFGGRNYLKGRDIWDMYFLRKNFEIAQIKRVNELVDKKIDDYLIGRKRFRVAFKNNLLLLQQKGEKIMIEEMEKYLPITYREIFKRQYPSICEDIFNFLSEMII